MRFEQPTGGTMTSSVALGMKSSIFLRMIVNTRDELYEQLIFTVRTSDFLEKQFNVLAELREDGKTVFYLVTLHNFTLVCQIVYTSSTSSALGASTASVALSVTYNYKSRLGTSNQREQVRILYTTYVARRLVSARREISVTDRRTDS